MIDRRLLLTTSALMLTGCDRLGWPGQQKPKASFNAVDITGANYGSTLALPDADGKPRTLAEFKGKLVFLFFGYTQCPDVCPTTMAELAQVKKTLGTEGERVQGVFVSVDPARDTPEVLKAYLGSFDPTFVALRGTPEQVAEMAKSFKVFYAKVQGKSETSYTMDHTAGAYVLDTNGQVRLFVRFGGKPEALAADLRALLAG